MTNPSHDPLNMDASAPLGGEQQVCGKPPYLRWRHPPGCPDADWCSGNGVCYWDCQGREDDSP